MHHSRKKSGHGSANTSMTDVRNHDASATPSKHRSSRPAMVRRQTPVGKLGKSAREREREWEEERWYDEDRESFPQYCMTCEKQFLPQDVRDLYCSNTCRAHDQNSVSTPSMPSRSQSYPANYPFYASGNPEPRDIIPRASPSRPSSTQFSTPTTPSSANHHQSAISALRSLSIRDPSPPSPTLTSTYHPSIWPFTRSAASPTSSYSRPTSTVFSSTYDTSYYTTSGSGYGMNSPSSERPLPPRRGGTYSRPKSIQLVTPMIGR